jgi:maltose alpha-D-glucosyltransferase / alpha-amylase
MTVPGRDPTWYKDAVIYELHVRAFYDSNGDGVGDFAGLTEKLDYLHGLGVTAIWLMPHYPSPLKDGGYDIADYQGVHPDYGSLGDFKTFVREAHRRGLKVITELVLNHTSDQHRWFQRAERAAPGTPAREFYVWSDTPERYGDARIIFKDFEQSNWTWNPTAGAYYWHRFYSHQPDLNYDNPAVRRAMTEVVDFWLRLGVDGLRLDAVPYLYEREGTSCENLPETHAFLKQLRRHMDRRFPDRMLLAEANQWPEDAAAYFGDGDECHMAFHFPLMPRLFMAIRTGDRLPIPDIQAQTPSIPETCQWATFLRNHDELTLEMVTEEERLYMYRIYAQAPEARINLGIRRRLAPLISNNRRRIELMNMLLFSLPGTPVIYYGDEIGMGDNVYLGDRDGVRTPMQWSTDRNAGFSRAHPHQLYLPLIVDPEYHHESVHVEAAENNSSSLLWFMKRLIALRKRYPAFGRGSLAFLHPDNHRVLAFLRRLQDERILIVANLSRFVQSVELDLSAVEGLVPVELLSRTPFQPVGAEPYVLTLGPHALYWFSLEPERPARIRRPAAAGPASLPEIVTRGGWEEVVLGEARNALEAILPDYLAAQRWFGGKGRRMLSARIVETVVVPHSQTRSYLCLVKVEYPDGEPETYMLPLAFASEEWPHQRWEGPPGAFIARLCWERASRSGAGILYDATYDSGLPGTLLNVGARRLKGAAGDVVTRSASALGRPLRPPQGVPRDAVSYAEGSNTTILLGNWLSLKLYRHLDAGAHPEEEIGRFLSRQGFTHVPPFVGTLEYQRPRHEPVVLAVLHGVVPNEGTGWELALESLHDYLGHAPTSPSLSPAAWPSDGLVLERAEQGVPEEEMERLGAFLGFAALLGRQTAELHQVLSSDSTDPSFAPEPFTRFYQRSRYQAARGLVGRVLRELRRETGHLPDPAQKLARALLECEQDLLARFRWLLQRTVTATRIRCHGDLNLEQILLRGDDLVIIDFEGEPRRPLGERRLKASPLLDVAGMLRSFDYAARYALAVHVDDAAPATGDPGRGPLEQRARSWYWWVSATFLREYLRAAEDGQSLLPQGEELPLLLDALLLEKAVYELGYELGDRPEWIEIPLRGILELLKPA